MLKQREYCLSTQEINNALAKWIYNCQQTCFDQEFKHLKSKAAKYLPLIRQLRLFLDKNNFIRSGSRIQNAPLSEMTKFLYLLPFKHPLTNLIINMASAPNEANGTLSCRYGASCKLLAGFVEIKEH